MKKKSLLITDEQRYGPSSPAVAYNPKDKGKKSKQGVTVTLYGPQVDAFCACSLQVGEKGKATVDFVVKAVSQGDQYGSDMPSKDKPKQVTLLLTDAHALDADGEDLEDEDGDDDAAEDEAGDDESKEEAGASDEGDDADEDEDESGEAAAADKEKPASKKTVSPKEADL